MENFARYVRQFEEAEQALKAGRDEAERARDYFDGNQFTAEEVKLLKRRGQPITPENLIKPKVQALCGLERQGRTDPKAYPRTQQHDGEANAATDALRYVADDQDINITKSRVFENMMVEGYGGVEVCVRKLKNGSVDPYVVQIAHDRLYYDPHSRAHDFTDANYLGYVTWMDEADALRHAANGGRWAGKEDIIKSTMSAPFSSNALSFDDKPNWATWADQKRKRIRINTHYHLEGGVWNRCVFTLAGELEEAAPVVFLDDEGNPECPLLMESAYIDRDNDRYGIVRDMFPLQDEVNKRRSKFLHMVSNSKVRVSRTAGADAEMIRKEMARPDGVIVAEDGELEELGNTGKEAGQFQLLADSRATLKGNIGPNAYLSGKQGSDQSGRAILAQQQAGMTEMAPLLDNLRHFTLRLYRQVWNRIRQFWTGERWIRVTGDEENVRFVQLNGPPAITPQQAMAGAMKVRLALQAGEVDQQTAAAYVAELQRLTHVQNPIAELDVDIEIDEVADSPTLQGEQFEALTQLVSSGMLGNPVPPEVRKMVIQASQLRDKPKILQLLDQAEKAAEQPNPMQDLQVRGAQAKVAKDEADVGKTQAETALAVSRAQSEQAKTIAAAFGAHAATAVPHPHFLAS